MEGIEGIGSVSAAQGQEWINLVSSGVNVTLNIIDPDVASQFTISGPNNVTGGFLSTYTSWGPTYELDIKPQISAPGGNILSTYPLALGGYAVLSGTSMACPLAAAVVALIGQVRGTLDPATIENAMVSTANPNLFNDGRTSFPYLAPVAQQGAGLLQAFDAAYVNATLSVSSIAFNDTDHFLGTKSFTIRNIGSEAITYALSNVGAATAYTFTNGSANPAPFPNPLVSASAELAFSQSEITLRPGARTNVQVTLTPPTGLAASRLPVYGGYIALNGSNGDNLSIPYQGVAGSMRAQQVLDPEGAYLSRSTAAPDYLPVSANTTFTLPSPAHNTTVAQNMTVYPEIVANLFLGTAIFRADVVPVGRVNATTTNVLGVNTIGERTVSGSALMPTNQLISPPAGSISGFPATYQPRGTLLHEWDGTLAGGRVAPAGTYTILLRTLRIFGDPAVAEDYDHQSSVPFAIRYK